MKIELSIQPRQSGKTTMLVQKATHLSRHGKRVLIITLNSGFEVDIKHKLLDAGAVSQQIVVATCQNFLCKSRGINFDAILCDEWLFFPSNVQKEIRDSQVSRLYDRGDTLLYMVSTPKYMYSKDLIETCREITTRGDYKSLKMYIDLYYSTRCGSAGYNPDEKQSLLTSFITDNITITHMTRDLSSSDMAHWVGVYGSAFKDRIASEICGKYMM